MKVSECMCECWREGTVVAIVSSPVWLIVCVLWPFQLDLEAFPAQLVTVHGADGSVAGLRVVIADEPKALAQVGEFVHKDFGAQDVAIWRKQLHQVIVLDVIGKVVDKQVSSVWT